MQLKIGQWVLKLTGKGGQSVADGDEIESYEISNPAPDGSKRFYEVVPGQFGQPLIVQEPSGGIPLPPGLGYKDPFGASVGVPTGRIVGAVFQREDGRVAQGADGKPLRFSLSNPYAPELGTMDSGQLTLNGELWRLVRVHHADRGRIQGWVAFFRPAAQTPSGFAVIVSELENVGV